MVEEIGWTAWPLMKPSSLYGEALPNAPMTTASIVGYRSVAQMLPQPAWRPSLQADRITLRELLTHTHGIDPESVPAQLRVNFSGVYRDNAALLHWLVQATPAASPTGRAQASIVWDSFRDVAVMYGGGNTSLFGGPSIDQTWEYDGATWTRITTVNSPGGLALPRIQAVSDVLAAFGWRGARQDPARV